MPNMTIGTHANGRALNRHPDLHRQILHRNRTWSPRM